MSFLTPTIGSLAAVILVAASSAQSATLSAVTSGSRGTVLHVGVATDDREKIFSLFESRKGIRGTGLGLPVSAKIMREHGGDIQIIDSQIGGGTCFRLRLPAGGTNLSDLAQRDTMI